MFLCKTVLQVNEWPVNKPKWPLSSQWDFLCTLNLGEMKLFYCKHNPRCDVTTAVRLANSFASSTIRYSRKTVTDTSRHVTRERQRET